jgi:hypothetical protein
MPYALHYAPQLCVQDRRARYPRDKGGKDKAPRNDHDQPYAARAQAFDASARWQRITELNTRLGERLDADGRALWQALEEALHVHWLDVAVDHYNRGYNAGRSQAWVDATLADRASAQEKLRALSVALAELVDAIERQAGGH